MRVRTHVGTFWPRTDGTQGRMRESNQNLEVGYLLPNPKCLLLIADPPDFHVQVPLQPARDRIIGQRF